MTTEICGRAPGEHLRAWSPPANLVAGRRARVSAYLVAGVEPALVGRSLGDDFRAWSPGVEASRRSTRLVPA
jgi:hypothetical protein